MQAFENMSIKTKIILSIIGISAVVVPTLLLVFFSRNPEPIPQVDTSSRQIDQSKLEELRRNISQSPAPVVVPTPPPVVPTPAVIIPTPVSNPAGQATPGAR